MPDRNHDALSTRLDGILVPSTPPPEALLTMVRRRRRVRQARLATVALLVMLALTPLVWTLRGGTTPTPIVENPDRPAPQSPRREVVIDAPGETSLQHLMALNRDTDHSEVVLPEAPGGRVPGVLRVLDTLNPEAALEHL